MKRIFAFVFVLCLCTSLGAAAHADHLTGAESWTVTFTPDEKMESNFSSSGYADEVSNLQPGDDITLTVTLRNASDKSTDWYMTNEVISSLEDGTSASGGAYSYTLTYRDMYGAENVLYSSDTVGGEGDGSGGDGLHEATNALSDYFYLDALGSGAESTITLNVALDGETQGNAYLGTQAALQMNFAVEVDATVTEGDATPTPAPTPTAAPEQTQTATETTPAPTDTPASTPAPGSDVGTVVKTGDEMNLFPFYVAMAVSGVLFLILAIDSVRRRRKGE